MKSRARALSVLAILLIPAGLCVTFGEMVKDRRQGWAILAAMTALLLVFLIPCTVAEQSGNPAFKHLGLATTANWEGKEARFGIENSALWASATTAASNATDMPDAIRLASPILRWKPARSASASLSNMSGMVTA